MMEENPYTSPRAASSSPARHSWVGIGSFAIALSVALVEAVTIPLSVYLAYSGVSQKSAAAILTVLVVAGGVMFDVVAFGMGIIALFQADRKRLFALLGLFISILPPIALALMVFFGA